MTEKERERQQKKKETERTNERDREREKYTDWAVGLQAVIYFGFHLFPDWDVWLLNVLSVVSPCKIFSPKGILVSLYPKCTRSLKACLVFEVCVFSSALKLQINVFKWKICLEPLNVQLNIGRGFVQPSIFKSLWEKNKRKEKTKSNQHYFYFWCNVANNTFHFRWVFKALIPVIMTFCHDPSSSVVRCHHQQASS